MFRGTHDSCIVLSQALNSITGGTRVLFSSGIALKHVYAVHIESGAPGENRTPNHLLRRQMLYPLSYGRTVEISTTNYLLIRLRRTPRQAPTFELPFD